MERTIRPRKVLARGVLDIAQGGAARGRTELVGRPFDNFAWPLRGRSHASESETVLRAVTSLVVHHTVLDVGDAHVDAGSTSVFVVGRYLDSFRLEQGRWLLTDRTVRLETRQLGIGTHLID